MKNPLLQIHLAVLLFGISGLFGKLLPLDAIAIGSVMREQVRS
jgi:hypothetical protein